MKIAYAVVVLGALACMAVPTAIQVHVRLAYRRAARNHPRNDHVSA